MAGGHCAFRNGPVEILSTHSNGSLNQPHLCLTLQRALAGNATMMKQLRLLAGRGCLRMLDAGDLNVYACLERTHAAGKGVLLSMRRRCTGCSHRGNSFWAPMQR